MWVKNVAGGEVTRVRVEDTAPAAYVHFLYRANSAQCGTKPRVHLYLPCRAGLFEVAQDVVHSTAYDAGTRRGTMTLTSYHVTGARCALFNIPHRREAAIEAVSSEFLNRNMAWRDSNGRSVPLALAWSRNIHGIAASLPDDDDVQQRLLSLLADQKAWQSENDQFEQRMAREREEERVRRVVEDKRIQRILARRQARQREQ